VVNLADWREQLRKDGIPPKAKRAVYEILKYNPRLPFAEIKKSISNRGIRVKDGRLRKFLDNDANIDTVLDKDDFHHRRKLYYLKE
tara:strand:+ start:673 stop:930 length:258 start_codon:yes stop_codon:yes gene_type:complete